MENIGKRIEALRVARGWSQTEAAKQLQIKQPSLSDIEKGVTKTLRGETVANLCQVFHTTAEYIYYGSRNSDDQELPLVEGELIYILRKLSPERRQALLDSARGIFNGQAQSDRNNPYPAAGPPGFKYPKKNQEPPLVKNAPKPVSAKRGT